MSVSVMLAGIRVSASFLCPYCVRNCHTCGHEGRGRTHAPNRLVVQGHEAVQKAQELQPDVILLDIGLPVLNGIEAASQIRNIVPNAKVVFLTQNSDPDVVRAALSDGVAGYVLKTDAGRDLLPAIEAVLRGEIFISSGVESSSLT